MSPYVQLTFFEALLLGHLLGDYVFQNTWMASKKSRHTIPCIIHCVIYTLCICALTSWESWWAAAVFLSHFIPDRFGLAEMWLRATRSRSIADFLRQSHKSTPFSDDESQEDMRENYMILMGGFTTFVYVVVDNTLHLLLMLLAKHYLVMHAFIN